MTLRTNSTQVLSAARPAALIGVLVLLWGISFAPSALALPPGGAATVDTPGTSSSVSPGSVEQCGSINFEVNGFPAGETVNVKIDDGNVSGGDASVQGQGVVVRQPIDSSGTASGTVDIPCDFPTGSHWLRFLATGGEQNKGYTNRSPDFEVTAQSGGGGGDSTDSGDSGDSGTSGGGTTGGGGTTNSGGGNSAGGGTASRGNTASGSRGNTASDDDDDEDEDDEEESTTSGGGGGGASGGAVSAGGGGGGGASSGGSSGGSGGGTSSGSTSSGGSRSSSGGSSSGGSSSGGSGGSSGSSSGGGSSSSSKSGSGGSTKTSGAKAAGSTKSTTGNKAKASGFANKKSSKKSNNSDGPSNGGLFDKAAQDEEITPTASSVPYIGFFVGGAILLVGMTAINAWLYLQRNAAATAAATAAAAANATSRQNQYNQQEQAHHDDNPFENPFEDFGTGNYRS